MRVNRAWYALVLVCGVLIGCGSSGAETGGGSAAADGKPNLAALPVPQGSSQLAATPDVAMFLTELAPEAAREECQKLLAAQGWSPYGEAGDTRFFKRDRYRLTANITSAPAQGGKTMIQYSGELMQADLPAPEIEDVKNLQYADSTKSLNFETSASLDAVVDAYRQQLAQQKWEATTEKPLEIDSNRVLTFRNPAKELLELQMRQFDSHTRVALKYQTAAEVEELDRRAKEMAAKKVAEANKPAERVTLRLPAEATAAKWAKTHVEFQVPAGKSQAIVAAWGEQLSADGWKVETQAQDANAGSYSLEKADQRLSIRYIDTGFLPGDVSVMSTSGAELADGASN